MTAAEGLDPAAVNAWVQSGNSLVDYPDGDAVDGSILAVDCDIAIPAALEGTLNNPIAEHVTATVVVEGANGPTTPSAEAILHDRGIAVVPDLMANGGGVISSYFEWAQNHQRVAWPEAEERRLVLERLDRSWDLLARHPFERWRTEALAIAISRVADAMAFAGQVTANAHGSFGDCGALSIEAGTRINTETGDEMAGYTINREDYLKRLRLIEGQVRGLSRMIEEDKYCIDVLTQVSSVTSALRSVGLGLVDEHLHNCVNDVTEADDAVRDRRIAEAVGAIERLSKT